MRPLPYLLRVGRYAFVCTKVQLARLFRFCSAAVRSSRMEAPACGYRRPHVSPVFTLGGISLPPGSFVTAERRASALDAALLMPGGELVLFPTYHPLFTSDFPHLSPPFSLDILHPPRKPGLLFFIVKSLLLTIKREEKRFLARVLADCGKCGYRVPDARRGASASRAR